MRSKWTNSVLVACLVAAGICGSPRAFAQGEDVRVDVYLKDADMLTATRALTAKTGLQFVFEPSSDAYSKVTLKLDQVTADDAIKYICQAAGATYKRDENGVYIIGHPKPASAEPLKNPVAPAVKQVKIVKRIKLMKADAQDVLERLYGFQPDPNRVWKNMSEFGGLMPKDELRAFGNNTPQMASFPVSQQNYQRPMTSKGDAGDIILPGEEAGQRGGGEGGGGGGGGGGFGGGGGGFGGGGQGGFGGGGGGIGGQGGVLSSQRTLIPPGIMQDYIVYDPTDNSIVVRGTEDDIAELQQNISRFDVAPRQVLIKVEFITTGTSLAKSLGYEFNYQRTNVFFGEQPGTFVRSSDPIFLSYATGNVTMRMRALLTEGFGKVVNSPVVRTLNNTQALLNNTVRTTFFTSQVVSTPSGNITSFTPNQISINTGISVTPRINGDDTITMALSPQIEDFGQVRTAPNGQSLPDTLQESVQVVARVKDGETIVLGGLNRKSDQGTLLRFPILADLPIIGQFFRSMTRDKNYSELLIFVTPTILKDEDIGGLGP